MSRLSSRLLAIAELDQGDSLIRVPVDLAELVDEIGHHWTNSATRHWHLEVQRTGAVPIAVDWVEQSIDALIENAVRFTTPDDVIRVSCGVSGESAFLEVADSGPGIDIEDRERVFDRFWHRPAVDGRPGNGLGLSTVRGVIRAHGGNVGVDTAPEGGALVRVTLPVGPAREVPPTASTLAPLVVGSPQSV
jgi:signal transduction histidine kinase